jgi:hypothetical protein
MNGDAATLFSGVAWTRGGQCTGPTLARRPFFPGPRPPKSRARSCSSHLKSTSHPPLAPRTWLGVCFLLSLPSFNTHCTLSNAFGSYTRCAFTSSYPLHLTTHKPTSIGYHTNVASLSSFNNTKVSQCEHPPIHPPIARPGPSHAAAAITATTRHVTLAQTRPPARVKRCTNQPLSQTTQPTKLSCRAQTDPPSSYPRPVIPKMSFKYLAPVVAIAAGRVAGKRRFANNKPSS